jgi:hypothetical protein
VFALLACVFCPCNIHADEPVAASNLETLPVQEEKPTVKRDRGESATQRQVINDGVIRIKVQGSYEVSISGFGVVKGEGTTTLELDGPKVERLTHEIEDLFRGSQPVGQDIVNAIVSLPSTIRSTNETLKMLSDPKTQEALRQVESLLRLLPSSTMHSERPTEDEPIKE